MELSCELNTYVFFRAAGPERPCGGSNAAGAAPPGCEAARLASEPCIFSHRGHPLGKPNRGTMVVKNMHTRPPAQPMVPSPRGGSAVAAGYCAVRLRNLCWGRWREGSWQRNTEATQPSSARNTEAGASQQTAGSCPRVGGVRWFSAKQAVRASVVVGRSRWAWRSRSF